MGQWFSTMTNNEQPADLTGISQNTRLSMYWVNHLRTDFILKLPDAYSPREVAQTTREAMEKMNEFTRGVYASIKANTASADLAVRKGVLTHLYLTGAPFQDSLGFARWIEEARWLHPMRRSSAMVNILAIIDADDSVETKLDCVWPICNAHTKRAFSPRNLRKDPEDLYVEEALGLKPMSQYHEKAPKPGDTCHICLESFSRKTIWHQGGPKAPVLTVCGHVFCKFCLTEWKLNCPMCRGCLVCGQGDCESHKPQEREYAIPMPLPDILSEIAPQYNLPPYAYFALREDSRRLRVQMAWQKNHIETDPCEHGGCEFNYGLMWDDMRILVQFYENAPFSRESMRAAHQTHPDAVSPSLNVDWI